MSTVLNKDKSIAAQNASTGAANIVAALARVGAVGINDVGEVFERIRTDIFENTLALAEEFVANVDPIAQVAQAFPEATNVSGTPQAQPQATVVGSYGKVIKPFAEIPDWLPAQFAASDCTPGEDLWDNRKDLPQFGGSRNAKSPWFKGADSGEGVWPPR